jgi:O-antigen ligase
VSAEVVHAADLEPSRISRRTYTTRRRFGRFDATSALCVMLVLLTFIPEQSVLPGASYAARPALVLCLMTFVWWLVARISPWLPVTGRQPIRWALFFFCLSMLISYAIGALRGLTTMESNAADNAMLIIAELVGIALLAADGVATWARLRTLIKVFLLCCGFMSVIALIQYIARIDIVTEFLYLPGLGVKGYINGLQGRGSEIRAAATAGHYIELSTVLAIAFPFALHFARFAPSKRFRHLWAGFVVLILAGNLVTVSRTGMASALIGLLTLIPMWDWRRRYNGLVMAVGAFAVLAVVKPGMARTAYDLVAGASTDESITSRTQRYAMVGYYFSQRPWFGRGSGTWVSPQYQFLDNSWLATALTNGIVGVAALAALFITAIVLGIRSIRRARRAEDKELCAAIVASQFIAIFATATYDSMYFTTGAVVIVLMVGLAGTVWRLTNPDRAVRTAAPRRWFTAVDRTAGNQPV